jgi:hypothetical protein
MKVEIQVGTMNPRLRNTIWNFVEALIPSGSQYRNTQHGAVQQIAADVLAVPSRHVDGQTPIWWLLSVVEKMPWNEVYDLLEYMVANCLHWSPWLSTREVLERANELLEREHSGYRFVAGQLSQIIDPAEIVEIEGAVAKATATGLDGARLHIDTSLRLFGQRPQPDYRNAIKEAISAVEAVVKIINGARGGGLHEALQAVSAKIEIHPALKAGLEKLYAYTSDEDGVRHAILEEATVDEADARFMIVTCSAFVNFLIVRAGAAGLLSSR